MTTITPYILIPVLGLVFLALIILWILRIFKPVQNKEDEVNE